MELIAFLIVVAAVKKFVFDAAVDGIHAVKGTTPPRYRAWLDSQPAGKRYGAWDYLRDLWHDSVEDARERRVGKRSAARAQRAADRDQPAGRDDQPAGRDDRAPAVDVPADKADQGRHGPADTAPDVLVLPDAPTDDEQPADEPAAAAGTGGPTTQQLRDLLAELNDPDNRHTPVDMPAANFRLIDRYWGRLMETGEWDDYSRQQDALTMRERNEEAHRWARMTPDQLAAELQADLAQRAAAREPAPETGADPKTPDASASGDGDQPSPLATVHPLRPTEGATTVSTSAESTGLTTSIAYAKAMSSGMGDNLSSTDQWIAQLSDRHGVSGEALECARRAVELQKAAAAAWGACASALGKQNTVKEAYQSTPGAGTREFVTSE